MPQAHKKYWISLLSEKKTFSCWWLNTKISQRFSGCFWPFGRDLCMVLCHSMNTGWMVGALRGGVDPTSCNQIHLNFLPLEAVRILHHTQCHSYPMSHQVKVSLPNNFLRLSFFWLFCIISFCSVLPSSITLFSISPSSLTYL